MKNKQTTKCPECIDGVVYAGRLENVDYITKDCNSCTGTAETVSEDKRNFARVRRSSDNAELDFTWQDIIKGNVLNWVNKNGTADGFVAIEYNPSGNGNDIVHTTAVHQPRLVTSGVLNTSNGKPALEKAYETHNYGCQYSSSCTGTTESTLQEKFEREFGIRFKGKGTGKQEQTMEERNVLKPMEERFYDEYRHIQHIKNEESGNTYKPIIDFIKQEIALAVQQERERICKLITNDNTKQFEGFLVIGTYKEHIIKAINKDL